jgi:hypothetical protein
VNPASCSNTILELLGNDEHEAPTVADPEHFQLIQRLRRRNHALIFTCVFSSRDFDEQDMDFERVFVRLMQGRSWLASAFGIFCLRSSSTRRMETRSAPAAFKFRSPGATTAGYSCRVQCSRAPRFFGSILTLSATINSTFPKPKMLRKEEGHTMKIGLSNRPLQAGLLVAGLAVMFGLAGCSWQNPILSSGPEPRVEDCMLLQQATPAKFVCNGKTYTAIQLTDIRNGTSTVPPAK